MKASASLVPYEASLLGVYVAIFSLYPDMYFYVLISSYKDTGQIRLFTTLFLLNYLFTFLKPQSAKVILRYQGLGFQRKNLGGVGLHNSAHNKFQSHIFSSQKKDVARVALKVYSKLLSILLTQIYRKKYRSQKYSSINFHKVDNFISNQTQTQTQTPFAPSTKVITSLISNRIH